MKLEAKLWQKIKQQTCSMNIMWTRIETGIIVPGVPDLHCIWRGVPFWLELKICNLRKNSFRCNLSPHQIGWQHQYSSKGGIVWNLIHRPSSSELILLNGDRSTEYGAKSLLTTADYRSPMKDLDWIEILDTITGMRET